MLWARFRREYIKKNWKDVGIWLSVCWGDVNCSPNFGKSRDSLVLVCVCVKFQANQLKSFVSFWTHLFFMNLCVPSYLKIFIFLNIFVHFKFAYVINKGEKGRHYGKSN